MPCYDPPDRKTKTVYRKDPRLVSLLCSACRALELFKFDFGLNPLLDEWWDKHKKEDKKKNER